jgi:hypothetical protein
MLRADHIENISTLFLPARVCWTVYRAVAWQRVDHICYNTSSREKLLRIIAEYRELLEIQEFIRLDIVSVLKIFIYIYIYIVVPRYMSLMRSRSVDLYQTGRIPNKFFP